MSALMLFTAGVVAAVVVAVVVVVAICVIVIGTRSARIKPQSW